MATQKVCVEGQYILFGVLSVMIFLLGNIVSAMHEDVIRKQEIIIKQLETQNKHAEETAEALTNIVGQIGRLP